MAANSHRTNGVKLSTSTMSPAALSVSTAPAKGSAAGEATWGHRYRPETTDVAAAD